MTDITKGFYFDKDGLYFEDKDKKDNIEHIWICSRLEVVALTRTAESTAWGRLIRIKDLDGKIKYWIMPANLLSNDGRQYREELLDRGLIIGPGKKVRHLLHLYLTVARPSARALCVDRIGWHRGSFVLPDDVIGNGLIDGERIVLHPAPSQNPFKVQGTLEGWQMGVGRYCIGNSRLMFAASTAFAAPLLEMIGAESGGFHLVGPSSIGKSTALQVAGSICGGGGLNGYVESWRATDNGLEGTAYNHCDTLLTLDEMAQIDPAAASESAYMLANGQGKKRMTKNATDKTVKSWRLLFLSTGEITLEDKIRENPWAGNIKAGQLVRIIDIPADAEAGLGLFEVLHDFKTSAAMADGLKKAIRENYGIPLRAYLFEISKSPDKFKEYVKAKVAEFVSAACPNDADGQVKRVATRFGLVAAGGALAAKLKIAPWDEMEPFIAAGHCFNAWLNQRGSNGPIEDTKAIEQVKAFLEVHGSSRFVDVATLNSPGYAEAKTMNRAGFKERRIEDDVYDYYVFPKVYRDEVCKGLNPNRVTKLLVDKGLIVKDSQGKNQVSKKFNGYPNQRYYKVKAEILEG